MGRRVILLLVGAVALGSLGAPQPVSAQAGLQADTLRLSLEEAVSRALRESEEIATAQAAVARKAGLHPFVQDLSQANV